MGLVGSIPIYRTKLLTLILNIMKTNKFNQVANSMVCESTDKTSAKTVKAVNQESILIYSTLLILGLMLLCFSIWGNL